MISTPASRRPRRGPSRSGLALLLVALLAVGLFTAGALLAGRSTVHMASFDRHRHGVQARYLAEAALHYALLEAARTTRSRSGSFPLGGGHASFSLRQGTDVHGFETLDIIALGKKDDRTLVLYAKAVANAAFVSSSGEPRKSPSSPGPNPSVALRYSHRVPAWVLRDHQTADLETMATSLLDPAEEHYRSRVRAANRRYFEVFQDVSVDRLRASLQSHIDSLL